MKAKIQVKETISTDQHPALALPINANIVNKVAVPFRLVFDKQWLDDTRSRNNPPSPFSPFMVRNLSYKSLCFVYL